MPQPGLAKQGVMGRAVWYGLLIVLLLMASRAEASVIHTPKFKVEGLVIVWQGDADGLAASAPRAVAGKALRHITPLSAASTPVMTGQLVPVARDDADETEFPLSTLSQEKTSFHVASNTAFNIDAELIGADALSLETLKGLAFEMLASLQGGPLSGTGQKAQYPHSAGARGGFNRDVRSLADLRQRNRVFTGNQRTAAHPGTIAEQSVTFTVTSSILAADTRSSRPSVVFTVFVP